MIKMTYHHSLVRRFSCVSEFIEAEHFDILNAFLFHHTQESYTYKNGLFLAHPVVSNTLK